MARFALAVMVVALGCGDDDSTPPLDDASTEEDGGPVVLDPPEVETTLGTVVGGRQNGSLEFLGIPYAAPPVGELRFRRPQPNEGWTEPLDATERPSRCEQEAIGISVPGSEDCLILNVHTPDPMPSDAPVLFWIHGGAFVFGEGIQTDGGTKGDLLARDHGLVVVSINYRLGPYGFMAHPAFDEDGAPGNVGFWDQLAALRWTRENVAAFGGDPDRITVVGESAGGVSVCALLASAQTEGMIAAAISQSGLCDDPLGSAADARDRAVALANALDCRGSNDAIRTCMRAATTEAIAAADPSADAGGLGARAWWPIVDGELVTGQFRDRLAEGAAADIPTLVGWNQDEGTLFVMLAEREGEVADAAAYDASVLELADRFGVDEAAIRAQYPMDASDPGVTIAAMLGDASLACPSRRAALLLAERGPTWAYLFTFPEPGFQLAAERDLGAFHSGEIQFVFGHPAAIGQRSFRGDEIAVHDSMSAYWAAFVTDHDPADAGGSAWPALDASAPEAMGLDVTPTVADDPFADACALWDAAR